MMENNTDSKITITGRHFHSKPTLKTYALKKAQKLIKHFDHIESISITMDRDRAHRNRQSIYEVKIHVSIPGKNLNLTDEESNMRRAIDSAVNRIDRELIKTKEKLKPQRSRPGIRHLGKFLSRVRIKKFRR